MLHNHLILQKVLDSAGTQVCHCGPLEKRLKLMSEVGPLDHEPQDDESLMHLNFSWTFAIEGFTYPTIHHSGQRNLILAVAG